MSDQLDLFGNAADQRLEVHEHLFVRGPRAKRGDRIFHSHPGGETPHRHPETGPACYTIDMDEWAALTGLKGGGRKEFTPQPSGERLDLVPLSPEESGFTVTILGTMPKTVGGEQEGGGIYAMSRMMLGHGLRPIFSVVQGGKE